MQDHISKGQVRRNKSSHEIKIYKNTSSYIEPYSTNKLKTKLIELIKINQQGRIKINKIIDASVHFRTLIKVQRCQDENSHKPGVAHSFSPVRVSVRRQHPNQNLNPGCLQAIIITTHNSLLNKTESDGPAGWLSLLGINVLI